LNVVALDTETTGLKPGFHEIIEFGGIRVTSSLKHEISRFSIKVLPRNIKVASPKALEINGYDPDGWVEAMPFESAHRWIYMFCEGADVLGHNVKFDIRFLRAGFKELGWRDPWSGRIIDTQTEVGARLKKRGFITSKSLEATAKYYELEQPEPHRALDDAILSLEVMRKFKASSDNSTKG
jgi:DNA polymerase III epsilon subunit-like protein